MDHFVYNPSLGHFYHRSGHLCRTPIDARTITLNPSASAGYTVADGNTQGLPIADIRKDVYGSYSVCRVGKEMRRRYLGQHSAPYNLIWRNANYDAGFLFYQGLYSPALGIYGPACMMHLSAYRFVIPVAYQDYMIRSASMTIRHWGTILQHQNAISHNCELDENEGVTCFASRCRTYDILDANSDWRGPWIQKFGIFQSVENLQPRNMYDDCTDEVSLDTHLALGTVNDPPNSRWQYWRTWPDGSVRYNDGYIPRSTTPWYQTVPLSSSIVGYLNTYRNGWIVGIPAVKAGSANNEDDPRYDVPFYDPGTGENAAGHWICSSYDNIRLNISIEL